MPNSFAGLVKTTTATIGVADYVLDTAALTTAHRTPKQAVADGSLTDGDSVQYVVQDKTILGDADFEIGEGIYTDATNTIARLAANVWDGSNGPGVLVTWPGTGQRDVAFLSVPSINAARLDQANVFLKNQTIEKTNRCIIQGHREDASIGAGDGIFTVLGKADIGNGLVGGGEIAIESDGTWAIGDSPARIVFKTTPVGSDSSVIAFRINESGNVSVGDYIAQTNLHIQESNTQTLPAVEIEQLSTGDAGIQFSTAGHAYSLAIDNDDSDYLKLSYAASAGTAAAGTGDVYSIDGSNGRIGINMNPTGAANDTVQIKSKGATDAALSVIESGSSAQVVQLQESAVYVFNSGNSTSVSLDATAVSDVKVQFLGLGANFAFGLDDTDDELKISSGVTLGTNDRLKISGSRVTCAVLLNLLQTSTAADPTTTEYPNDGDVGTHENTASGAKSWVWNDGGTILSVAMNAGGSEFASGTAMVFKQASAPLGWTQSVADNDAALRVVSAAPGVSGGSLALSSANTSSHTLTTNQMPAHTHGPGGSGTSFRTDQGAGASAESFVGGGGTFGSDTPTASAGGGSSHNHGLAIKYVDVMVATKD